MASVEATHYIIGSVVAPPLPASVAIFQASLVRRPGPVYQTTRAAPDVVVAALAVAVMLQIFTHSSLIPVELVGVKRSGRELTGDGMATIGFGSGRSARKLQLCCKNDGKRRRPFGVGGLDYPGVGPSMAMADSRRVSYVCRR